MATYVSRRKRQQRMIATVAVGAILAASVGWIAGRSSVPTVAEQVAQARASGEELATRISALTIEYEQAIAGKGDSIAAGVTQPLVGITSDLDTLLRRAIWVGPADAAKARRLVKAVATAADSKVDMTTFEQLTASAADTLRGLTG